MFTRSAITPPKVNRFRWNLEHCEHIVGDWPWQTLGSIRAVARVWEAGDILCFRPANSLTHDFADFQSATLYEIWTQQRRSVRRWKLTEFWKFDCKGSFFQKKMQKLLNKFPDLATSLRHNSTMITDRPKLTTKIAFYGMSSFHFYNQFKIIPLIWTPRTRKAFTQIFGNVRCPILCKPIRRCSAWRTDMEEKQTWIENWKSITRQITLTSLSRWHVTLGIVECRKPRACAQIADRFEPNTVLWHSTQYGHLVVFSF